MRQPLQRKRLTNSQCWSCKSGEARGPGSRWGDPARGIPTPKPPTVRESHEQGPPLELGPLVPCPSPKEVQEGRRVPSERVCLVGVLARGVIPPVLGQEARECHEPGPPNEPGPLAFIKEIETSWANIEPQKELF